jgi:hypothetical protein
MSPLTLDGPTLAALVDGHPQTRSQIRDAKAVDGDFFKDSDQAPNLTRSMATACLLRAGGAQGCDDAQRHLSPD